jgi:SAM-dependent methyltransferase
MLRLSLAVSYRRLLLDAELERLSAALSGVILDVGGKRLPRGRFVPPVDRVTRWARVNLDPAERPDILADAQALPVRDKVTDCVFCLEVLQYVESPEAVVREIARVLVPAGTAVLAAPFLHRADSSTDRHRFTEVRLRELVEQAGLRIVRVSKQGLFFTALANLLLQGVARLRPAPIRYAVAALVLPLAWSGVGFDRTAAACRSPFLSSFTTGFLVVARKA